MIENMGNGQETLKDIVEKEAEEEEHQQEEDIDLTSHELERALKGAYRSFVSIYKLHGLALTRGSSYIELPKWIKSKKAVINPQIRDEECI